MGLAIRQREVAPRLAAGAYILHAGIEKRSADEQTAAGLHGFASGTYPFFKGLEPATFVKILSTAEIAIGTTLLLPIVPAWLAGAVLSGFSGGLLAMYASTPGMRKPNSIWPTPQGMAISKDVWMLGIGLGLLTDAATRS